MGWSFNLDDDPIDNTGPDNPQTYFAYDPYDETYYDDPYESGGRSWTSFVIGLVAGTITLVVIAALIMTTIGYMFLTPDRETPPARSSAAQPVARGNPSESDLQNANYRPSEWSPVVQQFITPTPVSDTLLASANAEHELLINIYERVNPSVVNIEIVSRFHSATDIIDSSGSGFVYNLDGYIVTNAHVVREAEEILVTFFDGAVKNADVIGIDDYSDLAVIKVDPEGLTLVPVQMGDSNALRVGQRVIAIGNPFGLDGSMTDGIVSALGRSLPSAQLLDPEYQGYNNPSIIQIDAAVNPGNSGGPLLDATGAVIGINTAIRTENGGFQGIAFAVPVNTARRVIPQLIETGTADYSWLGIYTPSTDNGLSMAALAEDLDFPVRYGVLIDAVAEGSPAAQAGLRGGTEHETIRGALIPVDGDIIVAIEGQMVRDIDDLVAYLVENTSPGDTVTLTIVRGNQTLDLDVTLGRRPS